MIYIMLLGNFDSFTYNLAKQFCLLDAEAWVIHDGTSPPTIQATLLVDSCELLVPSLGPDQPKGVDCMPELLTWVRGRLPVLGVYLGHQALASAASSAVGEARKPLHGKSTSLHSGQHHPLFDDIADPCVVHYHSLVVSHLSGGFDCLANVGGGIMVMADPRSR